LSFLEFMKYWFELWIYLVWNEGKFTLFGARSANFPPLILHDIKKLNPLGLITTILQNLIKNPISIWLPKITRHNLINLSIKTYKLLSKFLPISRSFHSSHFKFHIGKIPIETPLPCLTHYCKMQFKKPIPRWPPK
jgi:hypothetical protein